MRLFVSLNFNDVVKNQINEVIKMVKSNSSQGKFVKEEHMHLTVEFLGEMEESRVDLIKEAMNELEFKAFKLRLSELGYFKRREGNIYWLGIEENNTLFNLQEKLHKSLINKGFELEDREYKPHITIGRKVKLRDGFNASDLDEIVRKIEIDINKVDLMKSEFTDGRLKHSIVYSRR